MSKEKLIFEVQENESIDECLDRIKRQGYSPIRRVEKPVFQEVVNGGQKTYEPAGRKIIFEAVEMH